MCEEVERTIVTQEEVAVDSVNRDGSSSLALLNEVERAVGWIEETLSIESLQVDDLEALGRADAEFRFEEMN